MEGTARGESYVGLKLIKQEPLETRRDGAQGSSALSGEDTDNRAVPRGPGHLEGLLPAQAMMLSLTPTGHFAGVREHQGPHPAVTGHGPPSGRGLSGRPLPLRI